MITNAKTRKFPQDGEKKQLRMSFEEFDKIIGIRHIYSDE